MFYTRIPYLTDEQEMTIKLDMLDTSFFDKYFVTNFKFRSIEEELNKILNIVSEWYENADYGDQTFLEINGCNEPAYIIIMQYYLLKTFKYISIDEVIIKYILILVFTIYISIIYKYMFILKESIWINRYQN